MSYRSIEQLVVHFLLQLLFPEVVFLSFLFPHFNPNSL
jgi:hypothetical protein